MGSEDYFILNELLFFVVGIVVFFVIRIIVDEYVHRQTIRQHNKMQEVYSRYRFNDNMIHKDNNNRLKLLKYKIDNIDFIESKTGNVVYLDQYLAKKNNKFNNGSGGDVA